MTKTIEKTIPFVLQMSPAIEVTEEQFFDFCQQNRDYRISRAATGEIIIMPPTGSETGNRNLKLSQQLANWTDKNKTGIAFDSSTGFTLPNGAIKSADAAWMKLEKWEAIAPEKQEKFAPVCPDFVVELRSASDNLQPLKDKLQEYIENGASLGWLIDRKNRQVYVYRPNLDVECLDNPARVSGQSVLPGFVLDLGTIW